MNRNNNFTMIHIIAACMVIIGHQFILMGMNPPVLMDINLHGLGVRVLFVVSGFLVSASYLRSGNPLKYLWKRISRLYPPLIFCLIISIFIMRFVTESVDGYWQSAWDYFLCNVEMRPKFDLAGVFLNNPYPGVVNGSLWSLPVELLCYFALVPIMEVYKLLNRIGRYISVAYMVVLMAVLSGIECYKMIHMEGSTIIYWGTDWFNGVTLGIWFLLGAGFYVLHWDKRCNWQIGMIAIVIYVCCPPILKNVLAPYIISYMIMCFGLAKKPLFSRLFKRDICYGLYLYAFPIQQLVLLKLLIEEGIHFSIWGYLGISMILIYIAAEVSYWIVEDKMLAVCSKLKNSLQNTLTNV